MTEEIKAIEGMREGTKRLQTIRQCLVTCAIASAVSNTKADEDRIVTCVRFIWLNLATTMG
jgi:hypothetical protein